MPKSISIGFIGCGHRAVGLMLTYRRARSCRIAAVCDRVERLALSAREALGDAAVAIYTDHRRMLREAKIDAVMIAVEPENNVDLVCEALGAGKHVMCEVPLAYTIEDCWRVVLAVEKSGLKFQMAEQVRHAPFARAWRKLVDVGRLGKVLLAEGQYLHGMNDDRFWLDSKTGQRLTVARARRHPRAVKSRFWKLRHPIFYLPHELSPILSILGDRVETVTGMSTRRPSYAREWFPNPDLEVALMHTKKDTILRMAAGFVVHTPPRSRTLGYHWYHLMGTRGSLETARSLDDSGKLWFTGMEAMAKADWKYSARDTPAEARGSGHGGTDFWPIHYFARAILRDEVPDMNVYVAADSAAPAILAALSAERGSVCLKVPDFRPGPHRRKVRMAGDSVAAISRSRPQGDGPRSGDRGYKSS